MFLKKLRDVIVLCVLVNLPIRFAFAFQIKSWSSSKRLVDETEENTEIDSPFIVCAEHQLRSIPGTYTFVSEGEKRYCSLYLAAPIDNVIELDFRSFSVDCENDGLVAILDGWEVDHEIFPNNEDHPHSIEQRYISFCGKSTPNAVYISKQNIAQLQFIVPHVGQGFRIKVTFIVNHKPCNMMLLTNHYEKVTLKNYGLRRNCTVMSLYSQRVQILYVNVGEKEKEAAFFDSLIDSGDGLRTKCQSPEGDDSVQLYQGAGVGSTRSKLIVGFCGLRQTSEIR